jgi:hypothetical protein
VVHPFLETTSVLAPPPSGALFIGPRAARRVPARAPDQGALHVMSRQERGDPDYEHSAALLRRRREEQLTTW